jgi:hypothetical protein
MKILGYELVLDHLDRMTDSTGLIQHAIYSIPRRRSGYTTDDNARALRLCARLWGLYPDERMLNRVTTYLSYLEFAHCPGGRFHNLLSYERTWLDAEGCGDCQGQAVLALAQVVASSLPADYRTLARELIEAVLPTLADLRSLRSQAYVIQSWSQLWTAGVNDLEPLEAVAWSAARRLVECYERSLRSDWQWFETRMTYANAVLPHALFLAAKRWPKESFLETAEVSFAFLDRATTVENVFWPVGNNGWYSQGEQKAPYDQQPVEAATMGDAALAAFGLRNEEIYRSTFRRTRDWFHGRNSMRQPLADGRRGACYDGLQASGINRNQGAESTLAYLWIELLNLEVERASGENRETVAASA